MGDRRVRVLDDDQDLADSVARLLARAGYDAAGTCDPHWLLGYLTETPIHCVVTDIAMPMMDGFTFAQAVHERDEGVAIIFMTGWPTTRDAVDAIRRHRGIDYIDKPLNEARLLAAVEEAVGWSLLRRRALARLAPLSRRERDVLSWLAKGFSNKLVAAELGLSVRTVEDHRAAIMRKTDAANISELVELVAILR